MGSPFYGHPVISPASNYYTTLLKAEAARKKHEEDRAIEIIKQKETRVKTENDNLTETLKTKIKDIYNKYNEQIIQYIKNTSELLDYVDISVINDLSIKQDELTDNEFYLKSIVLAKSVSTNLQDNLSNALLKEGTKIDIDMS